MHTPTARQSRIKNHLFFFGCLLVLVIAFILSLCLGAEPLNFIKAISEPDSFQNIILFRLRLPRSLLVMITGLLLGGSGAVFQLFFRNPLAEPGITGISSGATLGAVICTVLGLGTGIHLPAFFSPINLFAFCGSLGAGILVTFLAFSKAGKNSSVMLLLCGTALGTLYSSLSSIILLTSDKELFAIYSWILGSFNGRGWKELAFIIIPSAISCSIMYYLRNSLDLLTGGEKTAEALGLEVSRTRILVLICGSFAVSAAVCAGGTISFVGLIAPHIARKTAGSKGRILIPFSMIFGSILLLAADTIARTLIAPSEIPAGVITAVLGAPFFLSLCLKTTRQ